MSVPFRAIIQDMWASGVWLCQAHSKYHSGYVSGVGAWRPVVYCDISPIRCALSLQRNTIQDMCVWRLVVWEAHSKYHLGYVCEVSVCRAVICVFWYLAYSVCVLALFQNIIQDICVCAWRSFVYISLIRCVMTLPRNIIQDTCVCASVCVCMAAVSVFGVFRDSFQIAFIVCVCSRVCVCVCVCVVVITMTQTGVVDQGGGQPTGPRARDGQKRQSRGRERDLNFEWGRKHRPNVCSSMWPRLRPFEIN